MESTLKYVLVIITATLLAGGTAACKRADHDSDSGNAMSPGAASSSVPPAMGQPASGASQ
ncbi:hypothetical protein [Paraburkholderia aspalathi]|uniref:Uncharacterized protein n=1 Tax=Paraburkholderia aspalathi TaxID=1324617 RepID=A0A1I7EJ87_9BURK|nr:hypothetical protein [Paraburkholderia aspalathi]SFU23976.1 hypothetical protein SAMN05192563_102446 [Paraburkholderia aspalathi]